MGRRPCCEKVGLKRGKWTAEEDETLVKYIQAHVEGSWRSLPKNAGLLRCGKSCRLRWINYLRTYLKRGNFSVEEEDTIVKLQRSLGNKWSLIASHLPGRTDNEIKNYWNSHLSRKLYIYMRPCSESVPASTSVTKITFPCKRRGGRVSRLVAKKYKKITPLNITMTKTASESAVLDSSATDKATLPDPITGPSDGGCVNVHDSCKNSDIFTTPGVNLHSNAVTLCSNKETETEGLVPYQEADEEIIELNHIVETEVSTFDHDIENDQFMYLDNGTAGEETVVSIFDEDIGNDQFMCLLNNVTASEETVVSIFDENVGNDQFMCLDNNATASEKSLDSIFDEYIKNEFMFLYNNARAMEESLVSIFDEDTGNEFMCLDNAVIASEETVISNSIVDEDIRNTFMCLDNNVTASEERQRDIWSSNPEMVDFSAWSTVMNSWFEDECMETGWGGAQMKAFVAPLILKIFSALVQSIEDHSYQLNFELDATIIILKFLNTLRSCLNNIETYLGHFLKV